MNQFINLLKQSRDCGCDHVLMDEGAWLRIPHNADYQARVDKIKAAASKRIRRISICRSTCITR
jgi:hypothetical protein